MNAPPEISAMSARFGSNLLACAWAGGDENISVTATQAATQFLFIIGTSSGRKSCDKALRYQEMKFSLIVASRKETIK
jgi:hypothetical protein